MVNNAAWYQENNAIEPSNSASTISLDETCIEWMWGYILAPDRKSCLSCKKGYQPDPSKTTCIEISNAALLFCNDRQRKARRFGIAGTYYGARMV